MGDLLLASLDHVAILDAFRPRLACVAEPSYEIGRRGVDVLLGRIGNSEGPAKTLRLKTELRIGESSLRTKSN